MKHLEEESGNISRSVAQGEQGNPDHLIAGPGTSCDVLKSIGEGDPSIAVVVHQMLRNCALAAGTRAGERVISAISGTSLVDDWQLANARLPFVDSTSVVESIFVEAVLAGTHDADLEVEGP